MTGVQLATFPAADANTNGISDVEETLLRVTNRVGTYYGHALQAAFATFNNLDTALGNANMVFVSDGEPQDLGTYGADAAVLQDAGVNLRAFGAGTDATLATLRVIDPAARIFTRLRPHGRRGLCLLMVTAVGSLGKRVDWGISRKIVPL